MMTKTKYSISAASRVTGKSRTTIAKHLKAGKLSCLDDGSGAKLIDASELLRVYGDACDFASEEKNAEEGATTSSHSFATPSVAEATNLRERLDKEVAERERERQQLREQIEQLQESLQLAQEGHNRATLLLENQQAGGGGWEEAIASIERRLANQEADAKQERDKLKASAKRQIEHYKQQLDAELRKPFWEKLFG
ncbi:hypothetical protein [Adhaeretor mobilis]|nr:hypothetical protein [Adhaeretor mobilis]